MKLALLIGSGSDINGRKMKSQIDTANDIFIARINRHYGEEIDVGIQTHLIFGFDTSVIPDYLKHVQFINPYTLNDQAFIQSVRDRINYRNPSTGIMGLYWLLDNGYKPVVIGFGFKNGELINKIKTYPDGQQEISTWHNFALENEKLIELHEKGDILLL